MCDWRSAADKSLTFRWDWWRTDLAVGPADLWCYLWISSVFIFVSLCIIFAHWLWFLFVPFGSWLEAKTRQKKNEAINQVCYVILSRWRIGTDNPYCQILWCGLWQYVAQLMTPTECLPIWSLHGSAICQLSLEPVNSWHLTSEKWDTCSYILTRFRGHVIQPTLFHPQLRN